MHLMHLLGHAFYAIPSLVAGNWLEAVLGIFIFFVSQALLWKPWNRGWWAEVRSHWGERVGVGVVSVLAGWILLFLLSVVVSVYRDHQDATGRWRVVVNEKNQLKIDLKDRDDYIRHLEARSCPPIQKRVDRSEQPATQPKVLTDLQETVLRRELTACPGCRVQITSIGNSQEIIDQAQEIARQFIGWDVSQRHIGVLGGSEVSKGIEFAIPNPQERSVQMAIHAFDRARIPYSKNVSPSAFRGMEPNPPALVINVSE